MISSSKVHIQLPLAPGEKRQKGFAGSAILSNLSPANRGRKTRQNLGSFMAAVKMQNLKRLSFPKKNFPRFTKLEFFTYE